MTWGGEVYSPPYIFAAVRETFVVLREIVCGIQTAKGYEVADSYADIRRVSPIADWQLVWPCGLRHNICLFYCWELCCECSGGADGGSQWRCG